MKQQASLFLSVVFLGILCSPAATVLATTVGGSHDGTRHTSTSIWNRGSCYSYNNKKEDEWIPNNTPSAPSLQNQKRRKPCTAEELERHCEQLVHSTWRSEYLLQQQQAMECAVDLDCPPAPASAETENDTSSSNIRQDHDDDDHLEERKSWKEQPKRGKCQDENMGEIFDCNLIEILE
jgi:hypothetical protein